MVDRRKDHGLECGRIRRLALALTERGEEPGIGLHADLAQSVPVGGAEPSTDPEVIGVVDGGFDSQGPLLFEVGLDLVGLVADADLRIGLDGHHPCLEASRRASCDLTVDDQRHLLGASQIEMVPDGGLEAGPAVDGPIEHCGVGDLHLSRREVPVEPGCPVSVDQWAGQPGQPLLQAGTEMTGRELLAQPVRRRWILDRSQPVVDRLVGTPAASRWALTHS